MVLAEADEMNARTALLNAFAHYAVLYPAEQETAQRFSDFVQQYAECFERSLKIGHITGSAWVINRAGTHALFTHHRKLNVWLQVGGHADGDPNVARVAMREAEEESGLVDLILVSDAIFDLDAHTIPARGDEPEHVHYDVRYLIQATSDEPFQISDESHDLAWFSADEIMSRFEDESILRMARKWITTTNQQLPD